MTLDRIEGGGVGVGGRGTEQKGEWGEGGNGRDWGK
jgi:hypothetical protein